MRLSAGSARVIYPMATEWISEVLFQPEARFLEIQVSVLPFFLLFDHDYSYGQDHQPCHH